MEHDSISHRSKAHSSRGTTAPAGDFHGQRRRSEVARGTTPQRSESKKAQGAERGTCKDAGAQTDPVLEAKHTLPRQPPQALDERQIRNRRFENTGRTAVQLYNDGTQEPLQISVDSEPNDWPHGPVQVRYKTQEEPDAGFGVDMQSYPAGGAGLLVSGQNLERNDILDDKLDDKFNPYSRQPNQIVYVDNSTGDGAGAHLDYPTLPWGDLIWTGQDPGTHDGFQPAVENPRSIREGVALENLEDFIHRIEGEALVSLGKGEELWAVQDNELSVIGSPKPTRLELFEAADNNSLNDNTIMSGRTWFPSETDLLSTAMVDNARLIYPDLLANPESYSRDREEGYLAMPWRPTDMR